MAITQTIFRAAHGKQPYFMMLRTTAQDSSLSFEARGLIAYLLSKPNDWEINKLDLMREGGLGRTKMKRILDELTNCGYMKISQDHDPETKHFLHVVYTLHEEPAAENVLADPDTQNVSAGTGETADTKPAERETRRAANDHQHNTESIQNTDSTERSKDSSDDPKPESAPPTSIEPTRAPDDAPDGNEQKDDPVENDARGEKPVTDHQRMFQAVCDALGLDPAFLTKDRQSTIGKTAAQILDAKGKPEQISAFMRWLKDHAKDKGWDNISEHAMRKYWADYASLIQPKPPQIMRVTGAAMDAGEQHARVMAAYASGQYDDQINELVRKYRPQDHEVA